MWSLITGIWMNEMRQAKTNENVWELRECLFPQLGGLNVWVGCVGTGGFGYWKASGCQHYRELSNRKSQ